MHYTQWIGHMQTTGRSYSISGIADKNNEPTHHNKTELQVPLPPQCQCYRPDDLVERANTVNIEVGVRGEVSWRKCWLNNTVNSARKYLFMATSETTSKIDCNAKLKGPKRGMNFETR